MTQRYRTKGSMAHGERLTQIQWDTCARSAMTTVARDLTYPTGHKTIMYDNVVPGFHRLRQEGRVFMNSMSKSEETGFRSLDGHVNYKRHTDGYLNCSGVLHQTDNQEIGSLIEVIHSVLTRGRGIATGDRPLLTDLIGTDYGDAIIECSTSVQNQRGRADGNLWETLAESDKALGTLTGVFKAARSTWKSKNLQGFTKNVSGGYLGWRYGIKPLISDTQMVLDGLKKKVGRMRKTSRANSSFSKYAQRSMTWDGAQAYVDLSERQYDKLDIRAMSLDEFVQTELNNIGLTSKGLITLPWELVNKSFVLDWFLNVGDFLGAITPAIGWTQLGSCVVLKRERRIEIETLNTRPKAGNGVTFDVPCLGGYTYQLNTVNRNAGLPQPRVVVRSGFGFQNLTRCVDAFSLLASQVFNKR